MTGAQTDLGDERYLSLIAAAVIRHLRKVGGLTQEGLACELGFSQARVSQLETAQDLATLDVISKVASIVGAELSLVVRHPLIDDGEYKVSLQSGLAIRQHVIAKYPLSDLTARPVVKGTDKPSRSKKLAKKGQAEA